MTKHMLAVAAAGALMVSGVALGTAHAATPAAHSSMATVRINAENGSKVTGTAVFDYSSRTNITTVSLRVTGLKAMTIHPAHIHLGSSCLSNGPVVYTFRPLSSSKMMMTEAGNNGIMRASLSFRGSFSGKKYYINVHMGPTLATPAYAKPIACGALSSMM